MLPRISLANAGEKNVVARKRPTKSAYENYVQHFRKEYRKEHAKVSYDEKDMRKAAKASWEGMDEEVRDLSMRLVTTALSAIPIFLMVFIRVAKARAPYASTACEEAVAEAESSQVTPQVSNRHNRVDGRVCSCIM